MMILVMKSTEHRINNIIGQLEGIKKLLFNDSKDCMEVINQLKAAKSAVSSLMEKIISEEISSCVISDSNNEKLKKIIKEITK
jgi:DNA-binding FrmR family transcriptional regulator